jgi:hypothetical protein
MQMGTAVGYTSLWCGKRIDGVHPGPFDSLILRTYSPASDNRVARCELAETGFLTDYPTRQRRASTCPPEAERISHHDRRPVIKNLASIKTTL